jgi:RNA polymerase sigma-70 factor (ECF subfamily)
MRHSPLTDEQLAVRVQTGDLRAVTELYQRWKDGLFRFCCRMVSNADAAEDIIHDAFVKLIESRGRIQNPVSLKSWMYAVVRNEALTLLNKQKRSRPLADDDEEVFAAETSAAIMEQTEQQRQIERMLDRLLPQYKEIVLLREYEGMTYEEIAAVTGTTVSAVKSRLFKARKALTRYLEPLRKASDI